MASIDGSRSLQGASDETYDLLCGPCKADHEEKEAKFHCNDCREYLCSSCKDYHKKLPLTRNHVVVPGSQVLTKASAHARSGLSIFCGCIKNQVVVYYCADHRDVVCKSCKIVKHHKCKTSDIQDKSIGYTTTDFDLILSKAKTVKNKLNQLKNENVANSKELNSLKDSCKTDIKAFRKEINVAIDKLVNNMLSEVDRRPIEVQRHIDGLISTLTTMYTLFEADNKLLEDAKRDGKATTMFAADIKVSKELQGYENRLTDIEKTTVKPRLSFKRNKTLNDIITEVKVLGELKYESSGKMTTHRAKNVLLGRKIQLKREINVKSADDTKTSDITGMVVLSNGYSVLCDYENRTIKLMYRSWTLQETLKLSAEPFDVSVVDDNNVIISLPSQQQLLYIQVFPQLKAGHTLQLDKICWGVSVAGSKIYTTCYDDPLEGEVRILDNKGNLQTRLGVKSDGPFMFESPHYITVSPSSEKIFVSDVYKQTITCMTYDGHIIYQYNDRELKDPTGLYCDGGDNIFVCGIGSRNVQVIRNDGKKYGTLLSKKDGLEEYPRAIAYSESEDALIVSYDKTDNLSLFKLAK